jgi:hypothetical protein
MVDPVVPPVVPPTGDPWHKGFEPDALGFLQNRGWDKLDAPAAAKQAITAYREASSKLGVAPERLLQLPENMADAALMKPVWQKLGAPLDGKYDFTGLKHADGSDYAPAFIEQMGKIAAQFSLTKDAARGVAAEIAKAEASAGASQASERAAKLAEEKTVLAKNWGVNYQANEFIAKQAALKLGVTPEAVSALEGVVGYAKVMSMFHDLGIKIGEDKYVSSGGGGGNNAVLTVEQALDQKKALMGDSEWVTKYLNGDSEKQRQMTGLNRIIAGSQQMR